MQYMAGAEFNTKKNINSLDLGLTENSADCVKNNERQCNIFWLDENVNKQCITSKTLQSAYGDGCYLGERTESNGLEYEMV